MSERSAGVAGVAGVEGVDGGTYGPNDSGYINGHVRNAARQLVAASGLWCVGYGYKCEFMPSSHPIAKALAALAEADKETAPFANTKHDASLFKPYEPSMESFTAFHRRLG